MTNLYRHSDYVISFSVSDKPLFPQEPADGSLKVFQVEEGESLLIDLTAKANPADVEYKWRNPDGATLPNLATMESSEGMRSRLWASEGKLNVSEARRGDAGRYKVRATNDKGKTFMKFKLDVLYEPR